MKKDLASVNNIIIDFDGVLTDNTVITDENGKESVICNRSDGLGIRLINKHSLLRAKEIKMFVLSTERNKVVRERCKKLKIKCYQGIEDKGYFLDKYTKEGEEQNGYTEEKVILYIGNDLNDIPVIPHIDILAVPADGHPLLRSKADIQLKCIGGKGVMREIAEMLINIEEMPISELQELLK